MNPIDPAKLIRKPITPPSITHARGFTATGLSCGVKASGNADLAIILSNRPCTAAGVFTRNRFVGAPVDVTRDHIRQSARIGMRGLVCNSGIANVATGPPGIADAHVMCSALAEQIGCNPEQICVASTGIIGHRLPIEKITQGIAIAASQCAASESADEAAAHAIMTTDTRPKHARLERKIAGKTIRMGGIAKGAGMIAPDMATMLCFITTDAEINRTSARRALKQACNAPASFNRLSIDTDTSTSDMALLLANGAAGNTKIAPNTPEYRGFVAMLTELCQALAMQIICDGEGVTRIMRIEVSGAKTEAMAVRIGRAVADSPLFKCALHAGDANWGRIIAAIGKADRAVDPARTTVYLDKTKLIDHGEPAKFKPATLQRIMQQTCVPIRIDLGLGDAATTILGCDLSRDYITINADYHT